MKKEFKKKGQLPLGICPTVDYVFKLLFGSPERAAITIHFLNAILGQNLRIKRVEFHNPILGKQHEDDKYAIFLLNADKMTLEEIRQLFPDPEFSEAAGVLEMVSKNPKQRQLYDARLKFQRDEAARMELALSEGMEKGIEKGRVEGLREGIAKGEILGQIKLLQSLLNLSRPTPAEIIKYTEIQLSELVEELKRQLRNRKT